MKLLRVTKEERRALKVWLTGLLPERTSREDVADILGVTRKTISGMLNPDKAGFANGLTMLRYLQLVGAVDEAPETSPAASRLAELEEQVRESVALTREALELLRAMPERGREAPPAHPQSSD